MKSPSDHWMHNLILLIQECKAETEMTFGDFLEDAFAGLDRGADNYTLVQTLKEKFDMEGRRIRALSDMHPEVKPKEA